MTRTFRVEAMTCSVYDSNAALGQAAAQDVAQVLRAELAHKDETAVLLATGNSQLTFLHALGAEAGIDWQRVRVFQMDEYLGIPAEHPASFRRFHREHLVNKVNPKAFYGIEGDAADAKTEIARYTQLLNAYPPAATVLGIGENGHLAFNDPPADFHTPETMQVVKLDERSRRQQVGEGHFARLEDVPQEALSLTIPALLHPAHVFAVVPEARKAAAVRAALQGPVTPECPASLLRTFGKVRMYLDEEAASQLEFSV